MHLEPGGEIGIFVRGGGVVCIVSSVLAMYCLELTKSDSTSLHNLNMSSVATLNTVNIIFILSKNYQFPRALRQMHHALMLTPLDKLLWRNREKMYYNPQR